MSHDVTYYHGNKNEDYEFHQYYSVSKDLLLDMLGHDFLFYKLKEFALSHEETKDFAVATHKSGKWCKIWLDCEYMGDIDRENSINFNLFYEIFLSECNYICYECGAHASVEEHDNIQSSDGFICSSCVENLKKAKKKESDIKKKAKINKAKRDKKASEASASVELEIVGQKLSDFTFKEYGLTTEQTESVLKQSRKITEKMLKMKKPIDEITQEVKLAMDLIIQCFKMNPSMDMDKFVDSMGEVVAEKA